MFLPSHGQTIQIVIIMCYGLTNKAVKINGGAETANKKNLKTLKIFDIIYIKKGKEHER